MDPVTQPVEKLVLVFNANAGSLSALIDSTRKLLRINGCSLCSITHGLVGERREWKSCRETIGVPVDYLHRDELDSAMAEIVGNQLPCVLAESRGRMHLVLGPNVLKRCAGSVADFKGRLLHHAARLGLRIQ